ncbi:MAG: spore maturation protein [Provencibacterium sp.]|jgi:spore maturation protein B|nr:spore maturation protein [Provencibacterium sp.]
MQLLTLISNLVIPVVLCVILAHGLYKGVPVFDTFIAGAKEGLGVSLRLLPTLVGLMTAIGMFSASGALDILSHAFSPLTDFLQLPGELIPLALLRPISASGATALFQNLLETLGPDSMGGRIASVMMGSAETSVSSEINLSG